MLTYLNAVVKAAREAPEWLGNHSSEIHADVVADGKQQLGATINGVLVDFEKRAQSCGTGTKSWQTEKAPDFERSAFAAVAARAR